ncbi:MAG: 4-alpha-glucanotransferase [Lachnospiraceae bacterium]|nr:4-alpha-glucanotransferase [Lachnospiraceae bacterium]
MNRKAGVLMPIFSLPSKYGIGCFDQAAYDFVDYLTEAGQTYWQILPLSPTSFGKSDNSPYQSYSAFAGNPYFISLDVLVEEGVLTASEVENGDFGKRPGTIHYKKLNDNRYAILRKAYQRSHVNEDPAYQEFLTNNGWWLNDYALFMALHDFFEGKTWMEWPEDIRMHWDFAVDYYNRELYFETEFQKYMQFKFTQQWTKLKAYANSRHIQIIGDIPIYVSVNSTDVWAHPELFQLDEYHVPTATAGCPPDAFAADGQVWWNTLFNWDYHRSTGYEWWSSRLWYMFQMYDVVRIDHFRAFDEYFSVPYGSNSAADGHWKKGPGMDFFRTIEWRLGRKQVVAEDLGLMTNTVRQLVNETGYPNMKVLQFGFDKGDIGYGNDYLPHNYGHNCVVYTGTHDNETIVGWYQGLDEEMHHLVRNYLNDFYTPDDKIYKSFVAMALRSTADTCVIPIQDYLGLDNKARNNVPGTDSGNWCWRVTKSKLTEELKKEILVNTLQYGRLNWDNSEILEF